MLLIAWLGDMIRPTRDIDLLGFVDVSDSALVEIFREIATTEVELDGVVFDPATVTVSLIREEDAYGGRRVMLNGQLGPARLRVQVDIGIGDAVYPEPQKIEYPSLLDLPRPRLRAYSPETSVAEKLQAMVKLGSKNSRVRDFYDIRTLAQREPFDGERLARAIRATFDRRETAIPSAPLALTPAFAHVDGKRDQWNGFLRKNGLPSEDFAEVIQQVATFLLPVVAALSAQREFAKVWLPGGPWS